MPKSIRIKPDDSGAVRLKYADNEITAEDAGPLFGGHIFTKAPDVVAGPLFPGRIFSIIVASLDHLVAGDIAERFAGWHSERAEAGSVTIGVRGAADVEAVSSLATAIERQAPGTDMTIEFLSDEQ